MGTKEYQAEKPITVISVFKKTVERVPNNLALGKLYQIFSSCHPKGLLLSLCVCLSVYKKIAVRASNHLALCKI